MSMPDVLWVNTSPSLRCFAQPLLCHLSHQVTVRPWEYSQSQDEASSLDSAVLLLHDYGKDPEQSVLARTQDAVAAFRGVFEGLIK